MSGAIYGLCSLTALSCAWLLLAAYRRSRYRLLFWSGLCFVGLTVNNVVLIFDKLVFPETDMSVLRSGMGLVSIAVLLYGLIWNSD